MSNKTVDRRAFLKVMGVSGGGMFVALSGCAPAASIEEGVEVVTSYVDPQDFVIPGREVWYASTCHQCPAACGIHARVMEGRVRKLEGNPDSPINRGSLCSMGQAGLQQHYNPDRLQRPLARQDGKLVEIGWDDARQRLAEAMRGVHERKGAGFALLTGQVSGHLAGLMQSFVQSTGAGRHYAYELLGTSTARAVNRQVAGVATPQLNLDQASLVVSFGADFLGTWQSPVHFSGQYAAFRKQKRRGALIQVEPKMSLTGANADWWRPIRAGTEGWLMLGVARLLAQDPLIAARLPSAEMAKALQAYDLQRVSQETDIPADEIERLARALVKRSPSLVLVGGPAEAQEQGSRNVAAGWLLNHLLGNVGKTISAPGRSLHPELDAIAGSTRSLRDFAQALPALDTVFVHGTNPLYSGAAFIGLKEGLQSVKTKVVFASILDETAATADLVIPVRSYLEDWGTLVPAYSPQAGMIQVQQPVMQPLFAGPPAIGDVLLGLLAKKNEEYAQWSDFQAYLRHRVQALRIEADAAGMTPYKLPALLEPPVFKAAAPHEDFVPADLDRAFWEATVAAGLLRLPTGAAPVLKVKVRVPAIAAVAPEADYPFDFIASTRMGHYDGRHAHLPWLQELPDPLTTIVWDSWAELHPETAKKLGIASGDLIEISSAAGSLLVKAVLFPGIHPGAVAVPLGQGHEVGYARGIGVNPLHILVPKFDTESGELALCGTRVKIRNTGKKEVLVKLAPTEYQHERRIVRTVSARQVNLIKEG